MVPFLKDSCGFDTENKVKWVPISGFKNINISTKVDSKICPWYTGKCLLDVFDGVSVPKRDKDGPVRLPILDSF